MLDSKIYLRKRFYRERHANGQLALVCDEEQGHFKELSIAYDKIRLGRDEIILKDFSGDLELTEYLSKTGIISQTDRFVLIGSHVCPICKVLV